MDWSDQEFDCIELGDKRLNQRVKRVCQMLYEKPESSINAACGGWDDTKAAYRLFDNEKMDAEKILDAHREKTLSRMREEKIILAIQDTTFFNYHSHESKTGLGLIHSNKRPIQGLLAHNTLVANSSGLPLGLFEQKIYARKNKKTPTRQYVKIESKESYRWLESIRTLRTHLSTEQSCIVIGDREADIFELMQGCQSVGFDFIFRSTHDRVVGDKKLRRVKGKNSTEYLIEYVAKQKVNAKIEIEVEDQKTQKKRKAVLSVRFSPIVLPAPWKLDHAIDGPSRKHQDRPVGSRAKVEAFVVEVREENPPRGFQRVHWRLLTSIPVETVEAAKKIIEYYKIRWTIEIYHRVLKSGCKVEDCRLETIERLKRCLTLYSIIAWRLLWMSKINHAQPNRECIKVFSQDEWHAIYRISNKTKKIPKTIPNIREMIRGMAQLGGFLARKSDGEPGITTIWRGWQTLNTFLNLKTYG